MRRRRGVSAGALMVVLGGAGCGQPVLAHFDGHAFAPTGPLVELGTGWVAVDSCYAGIHALVELEVPVEQRGLLNAILEDVGMALGTARVRKPQRVELLGPFCWPGRAGRNVDGPAPGGAPGRATGPPSSGACLPLYIVRAEFDLPRVPRDGETVAVVHQNHRVAVRWTRR